MPELVALQTMLPKLETPVESQGKVLQLRQMLNANQVADMEMAQRRQALADDQAARAAFSANPSNNSARLAALAGVSPAAYGAEAKRQADLAKSGADTAETQLKTVARAFEIHRDRINLVNTPQDAEQWVKEAFSDPVTAPIVSRVGDLQTALSKIPQDPAAFQKWKVQAGLAANEYVKHTSVDANTAANNAVSTANSMRTAASSKYSADSSAATARDRLAFERDQGRNQVIQTDSGPMLVSKNTGEARPVTAEGVALPARAKEVPASVKKAMFENDAAIRKIDDALTEIDKYPSALGGMNILGDTIRQRTDPEGVKARALVADIGSLKLHDRSGAAVTAAETPRLKPFIPFATDSTETVKEKLGLFKREYQAIQDDMSAAYPAAASTRQASAAPSAKKPSTPKSSAANTNAKGWVLYTDAAGNRAYVSPDGNQFEEVK